MGGIHAALSIDRRLAFNTKVRVASTTDVHKPFSDDVILLFAGIVRERKRVIRLRLLEACGLRTAHPQ